MTLLARFDVTVSSDWPASRDRWSAGAEPTTATPFQSLPWLDAWYASFASAADVEPLLVDVRSGGALAVRLPLIVRRQAGRRVLQFSDLDLSDFNAPILGQAAPTTAIDASRLWQAVVAALPPVDLVTFRKMPPILDGRANPLALLATSAPCPLSGHLITLSDDWDVYHHGLDRHVRKEFERAWRVLTKAPDFRFVRLRDVAAAERAIDFLDRQQRARLLDAGHIFRLDGACEAAAYRYDLARRLATGDVIVTALMSGDDMVAALYGIADATTTVILRIGNAGGDWAKVSPGRLIVHRTLQHLHEHGVRAVDLSIGDYDYKRRMNPVATPLVDFVAAVSWKGSVSSLRHRAAIALRRYPAADAHLRRILSRSAA